MTLPWRVGARRVKGWLFGKRSRMLGVGMSLISTDFSGLQASEFGTSVGHALHGIPPRREAMAQGSVRRGWEMIEGTKMSVSAPKRAL